MACILAEAGGRNNSPDLVFVRALVRVLLQVIAQMLLQVFVPQQLLESTNLLSETLPCSNAYT